MYLNYLMLKGYITPFVLAMMISLFLWPIKMVLIEYLKPLRKVEMENFKYFAALKISWKKVKLVSYVFFRPLVKNK